MYSYGTLHMDKQRLDNQLEPTYNSSLPIQDVALKTPRSDGQCRQVVTEGQGDPCWQCNMVMMIFIHIYIYTYIFSLIKIPNNQSHYVSKIKVGDLSQW